MQRIHKCLIDEAKIATVAAFQKSLLYSQFGIGYFKEAFEEFRH